MENAGTAFAIFAVVVTAGCNSKADKNELAAEVRSITTADADRLVEKQKS